MDNRLLSKFQELRFHGMATSFFLKFEFRSRISVVFDSLFSPAYL
jgi:hypothetical protein